VTGIETPVRSIAALLHENNGYCFVDYACSAPYVKIDMHPDDHHYLDAIYFSPHKFLGGPGASGILVFGNHLYDNLVPDVSGGGTVDWTNPWGGRKYLNDTEMKEDGGTPAILQTIKAAYCMELKDEMGVSKIKEREGELMDILWKTLSPLPGIKILAREHHQRQGIISFWIEGMHHDTVVRKLSDNFGIQSRGGCSCAGTYGHFLLAINQTESKRITDMIDAGDESEKPGWIRISIHPTMTNIEANYIAESIASLVNQ
jgi:selenocysteine lyase/cysteine desulfurase